MNDITLRVQKGNGSASTSVLASGNLNAVKSDTVFKALQEAFANDYFDDAATIDGVPVVKTARANRTPTGDIIHGLIDNYTGEPVTFVKVTLKPDGTPYTNTDINGVTIRKKGSEYFKRNFTDAVNVKWFGAKGDGITDDTNAFNAAILSATGGGLYIPYTDQSYLIHNVTVNKYLTISGDNRWTSRIKPYVDNAPCFVSAIDFTEFNNLNFNAGSFTSSTGIQFTHSIGTIDKCTFVGLYKAILNSATGTVNNTDEQEIRNCRIINCTYGIYSEGRFINAKIFNTIIHGCKCAIYIKDDSYDSSSITTEGATIDNCLIYSCGDPLLNLAAIQIENADFSYIRNVMADQNLHVSLRVINSQNCKVDNCYFSSGFNTASSVEVIGNCSRSWFTGVDFFDAKRYGLEIVQQAGRYSFAVRIINCNGRLNNMGDIHIDSADYVNVSNCDFYSAVVSQTIIIDKSSSIPTSLFITNTLLLGTIQKNDASVIVRIFEGAAANPDVSSANATDLGSVISLANELKSRVNSLQSKMRDSSLLDEV